MIEYPEEPRASSPGGSGRAGAATEAEVWLRRELAFLHRVERRILRRARWRREAWRAVTVGSILAVFALCWYLAAVATGSSAHASCTGKSTTTAAAQGSSTQGAKAQSSSAPGSTAQGSSAQGSGTTSTTKTASGTAASCGS